MKPVFGSFRCDVGSQAVVGFGQFQLIELGVGLGQAGVVFFPIVVDFDGLFAVVRCQFPLLFGNCDFSQVVKSLIVVIFQLQGFFQKGFGFLWMAHLQLALTHAEQQISVGTKVVLNFFTNIKGQGVAL